ncbi:hypothetical protein NLJ89_g7861 [Agrocybe chaxingu]|uniref:DUF6533 domain-containing protein n=1 Tax=Agrocybe chaxingu TaxID=84603 RepID=A0A9W8K3J7_9AGAR|nr:hypothetical protein NLJ89_g7861 [Agrocybe chaxingu]
MLADSRSLSVLQADQIGGYVYAALGVATLYDHAITLEDEVECIWKRSRIKIPQALFLINRYIGTGILVYSAIAIALATTIQPRSIPRCNVLNNLQEWGAVLVVWSMQGIMVYRISAMYQHYNLITAVQLVFFAIEIISTSIMKGLVQDEVIDLSCNLLVYPVWYGWSWAPILCFEALMFFLSLWSGIVYYREALKRSDALLTSERNSMSYVLLRDSISFPFLALVVVLINIFGWSRFSPNAAHINAGIAIFAPRILGCRLILNLRESYYRPFKDELSMNNHTLPRVGNEPLRFNHSRTQDTRASV